MARPRYVPSDQQLKRLLEQGMTHDDIVAHIEATDGIRVSRSTVSAAISRAGLSTTQHRYSEEIPWTVKTQHLRDYQPRMLRLLGRRRAGEELNEIENSRLTNWLAMLDADNAVVGYDPEVGFAYIDRSDDDPVDVPIHRQPIRLAPPK